MQDHLRLNQIREIAWFVLLVNLFLCIMPFVDLRQNYTISIKEIRKTDVENYLTIIPCKH